MQNIPRSEYPRRELIRPEWENLNGEWEFALDATGELSDGQILSENPLPRRITLPFCPESRLSGIGETDFIKHVCYRRAIRIPSEWEGRRILLHIGACDYETKIYLNGSLVGSHKGGYTPITADLTDALIPGDNILEISAWDDVCDYRQASGKQSRKKESHGCFYTRTTGIWQTVWMEPVSDLHIASYAVDCDIENAIVSLSVKIPGGAEGKKLTAEVYYDGRPVGVGQTAIASGAQELSVALSEKHLWEAGCGRLYDLTMRIEDDTTVYDEVEGYFGLRTVRLQKDGFYLNGEKLFLRTVLDQGFYPDGIYTAPSDDALREDVEKSMALGFNGARLHQKVFEPGFLYHADKLGYLLFGEAGNWGLDHTNANNIYHFLPEWLEEVERDRMHPSIIGWCPFNETWDIEGRRQSNELLDTVYTVTKAIDRTRPVVANSGSYPSQSDVNDIHDYEQDPEKFKETFAHLPAEVRCQLWRKDAARQKYDPSLPLFVSEYGGIGWSIGENGWGYGKSVGSPEEFLARLEGLTDVILSVPEAFGFCYTQLYDVEQEQNGLLTYDRKFKFPPEQIARILKKPRTV